MHSKTKHIPIKYHFLREQDVNQVVKLDYVAIKDQVAYIFTKTLPKATFEQLNKQMGFLPVTKPRCVREISRIDIRLERSKKGEVVGIQGGEATQRELQYEKSFSQFKDSITTKDKY